MGVLHKFGERFHCNPLHIAVMTMSTACVVSLFAALGQGSSLTTMPVGVAFFAIPFGHLGRGRALAFSARTRLRQDRHELALDQPFRQHSNGSLGGRLP